MSKTHWYLTIMKWFISLLISSLRSAFFSLQFWPEYLWKVWIIVIMLLSRSDTESFVAWDKHFNQFWLMCFAPYKEGSCLSVWFLFIKYIISMNTAYCILIMQEKYINKILSFLPPSVEACLSSKDLKCDWRLLEQTVFCLAQNYLGHSTVLINHLPHAT